LTFQKWNFDVFFWGHTSKKGKKGTKGFYEIMNSCGEIFIDFQSWLYVYGRHLCKKHFLSFSERSEVEDSEKRATLEVLGYGGRQKWTKNLDHHDERRLKIIHFLKKLNDLLKFLHSFREKHIFQLSVMERNSSSLVILHHITKHFISETNFLNYVSSVPKCACTHNFGLLQSINCINNVKLYLFIYVHNFKIFTPNETYIYKKVDNQSFALTFWIEK
jgi:hypothetical protein